MHRRLMLVAAVLCFLLPVRGADAAVRFGADETIHFIEDVKLKGANQEALYLGYRTKIQFFLAGLYLTDEGYVLGVKGDSKRYYDMPTGEKLAQFQKSGLLPDPLPPYSLSFWDYLFGYSLWWVIAFTIIWMVMSDRRKKRKAARVAAEPTAAPPPSTPVSGPPAA
jgi:hypothetical protein